MDAAAADPAPDADALSFDQWVVFLTATFRSRYQAHARTAYPELEPRLALSGPCRLTVVQVNAGEAVHFLFVATEAFGPTACRSLVVEPPEGIALRDWAMLHEEAYKAFVERSALGGARPGAHFVVFPADGDAHAAAVLAADRAVRDHAAALRPARGA